MAEITTELLFKEKPPRAAFDQYHESNRVLGEAAQFVHGPKLPPEQSATNFSTADDLFIEQLQHRARQRLGHLDAVDPGGHDPARITGAFAGGVQALHVQALQVAAARDAQR